MSSGGGVVVIKTEEAEEEEEEDGPGFVFVRPEFSEGAMAAVSLNYEPTLTDALLTEIHYPLCVIHCL